MTAPVWKMRPKICLPSCAPALALLMMTQPRCAATPPSHAARKSGCVAGFPDLVTVCQHWCFEMLRAWACDRSNVRWVQVGGQRTSFAPELETTAQPNRSFARADLHVEWPTGELHLTPVDSTYCLLPRRRSAAATYRPAKHMPAAGGCTPAIGLRARVKAPVHVPLRQLAAQHATFSLPAVHQRPHEAAPPQTTSPNEHKHSKPGAQSHVGLAGEVDSCNVSPALVKAPRLLAHYLIAHPEASDANRVRCAASFALQIKRL